MPLFIIVLLLGFVLGFIAVHLHMPIMMAQQQQQAQPIDINVTTSGGDDRYSRPPRPQRLWDNGPEYPPRGALLPRDGGRLINVPSRGLPESYQQMGILKKDSGDLIPLYGRRVGSRSDRFNYYTRTDSYNPLPLPINYKRRDCQDSVGCDELFNGDQIVVSPTGEKATATLYQFDGPTYIPSII